jgi:hypothetical protein
MLYSVSNKYKDGYVEDFISTNPNIDQDNIVGSIVFPFKYRIKSFLRPGMLTIQGKKYIMPGWIPCHPETQLTDIIHIKPIIKKVVIEKIEKHEYEFMSSNGKDKYFVRVIGESIKCTCPGFWVSKGNCKHVKEIRSTKF